MKNKDFGYQWLVNQPLTSLCNNIPMVLPNKYSFSHRVRTRYLCSCPRSGHSVDHIGSKRKPSHTDGYQCNIKAKIPMTTRTSNTVLKAKCIRKSGIRMPAPEWQKKSHCVKSPGDAVKALIGGLYLAHNQVFHDSAPKNW